jgi:hypothetical protein
VACGCGAGLVEACSLLTDLGGLSDASCTGTACAEAGSDAGLDGDAATTADASDAGPRCDKSKPFGIPALVSELRDQTNGTGEIAARLTSDELTVFFTHVASNGDLRIYEATRSTPTATFSPPQEVTSLHGSGTIDAYATPVGDGLTMYLQSQVDGGSNFGIFQASRPNSTASFSTPQLVGTLDTLGYDGQPYVAPDGVSDLYFARGDAGSGGPLDIYVAKWTGSQFDNAVPVAGAVNTATAQDAPVITSDGLTLYFASNRAGTNDVYVATRTARTLPFGAATAVTELDDSTASDVPNWISPDECVIYMNSDRSTSGLHIYRAVR